MIRGIIDWLEERTGIEGHIKHFLYEDVPWSAGWHQVLGSVAMFAFLTQVFTGILLAFNYAPTPGDAYDSLKFIVTELTAGRLIRGLHHWGASLMIIVVVLHMTQVFVWGAYKKPRETTWITGAVLLLLTLAYGLTGYLLPWDNRAYWGTVVTTQIAAQAPGAGPYILRLLGSDGGSIGVVTFARFYAAHVLLLPPITMLLIAAHVYLVRRHGVTPTLDDAERAKKKFYPEQVYKDTVATFVWFAILFAMAVAVRVPLGRMADATDTSYIPRPEWYFLFLFQTLKFFDGPLEIVGSLVLPTIAIVLLFLVPFIDRGKVNRLRQRTGAIALILLAAIGWGGLTARAIATTPKSVEVDASLIEPWQEIPAEDLADVGYFRIAGCGGCHTLGKPAAGPDLLVGVTTKPADWLTAHIKNPSPSGPPSKLSGLQTRSLVKFLATRSEQATAAWNNAPNEMAEGAMVYQKNQCGMCHDLNGAGQKNGPILNGVGGRHDRAWLEAHFIDPQKFSPGSTMPPYKFTPTEMDRITTYLMEIPK